MLFTMRDELRRQAAQRFEIVGAEMEERGPAVSQSKVGRGWKRCWPPALPSLFLVTKAPTICTVACGARVIAVKQDVGPMLLRLIEV